MFELRRFSEQEVRRVGLSKELAVELSAGGVPVDVLGRFEAVREPYEVSTATRRVVCFGESGLREKICLDPQTGEVVQVGDGREEGTFVNTSLSHFRRVAQMLVERFPFHAAGADLEERERGASAVALAIESIDPCAMVPDRFWSTLVDDIAIGDFDPDLMDEEG